MSEIIFAFLGTILAEGVLGAFVGMNSKRFFVCMFIVNVLTNIPLNILLYFLGDSPMRVPIIAILEVVIFVSEGMFYRRFLKECKHPFLLSLFLNGSSLFAGVILAIAL